MRDINQALEGQARLQKRQGIEQACHCGLKPNNRVVLPAYQKGKRPIEQGLVEAGVRSDKQWRLATLD